ncbi:purine/pyrimidine permease [Ancylobacter sp. MQZ15Z-1]|uniref:Purine/pyrimidine permease n=1 Tax=Ancylobacter mangrovi TaxID=2972472 RepID=A0A9X2PBK2_9HYPH|nr:solute carrier family 23 protein [Ancylobacter mangrovi]MCS0495626.1 purine/pyrimidine permease [Ancylobacter mangrovi]
MTARYDLLSRPPPSVLLAAVAQHMGLMAVTLVFPLLVAQTAGVGQAVQVHYLQLSMLAMGLATLAQAWGGVLFGRARIGSGFLLPAVFTAAYLPAALAAARSGGLEAVAGLTIAAGLTEIVLSRFIGRLRPYLPVEIVGLTVLMIGIILGIVALKLMLGYDRSQPLAVTETGPALAALAIMVALAIWGGARLRSMAVLVGLAAGIGLHMGYGFAAGDAHLNVPVIVPELFTWPLVTPHFEAALLPGFLVGALACTLRAFGDMVASQKVNDRDWKRPDYANIEAGVLADGIGTLIAGVIGTMGLNTYSASVGLSVATEVLARRVAIGVGIGWIVLAFLPRAAGVLIAIPQGVLGAALLFASTYVVLSGMSILGQRLLDARRTLAVGLSFFLGISFDEMPGFYADHLPPALHPLITSSLVLALLTALVLNALFRIGTRKRHRLSWQPAAGVAPLLQFLADAGSQDGARGTAVLRLSQIAEEFAEAAPQLADDRMEVATRFDEYTLELAFSWHGRPLTGGAAPSLDETADEDAIMNGVALALMTRLADRLTTRSHAGGQHELVCQVEQ